MDDPTEITVARLRALAHALAESLSSYSEELSDPTEWHIRIAAGHARAIEDLLSGLADVTHERRRGPVATDDVWLNHPR